MEGKYFLYAGALLIVILVIGFSVAALVNAGSNGPLSRTVDINSNAYAVNTNNLNAGDVQVVNLKVSGAKYVLEPSVLKKGVPVKLVADIASMPGCAKGFRIPEFGVSKSVRIGDNVVEFTPNKVGTFAIACFMNMYTGTFTVTDDGTIASLPADAPQPVLPAASGGSCGAGGGGCGCGGGI